MKKMQRDTVFLEDAEILSHQAFAGDQFIMRLLAPHCAAKAMPGSFVHLTCDPQLPMRRPISIMRCSAKHGWIELLYKRVGKGTGLLAKRTTGEKISLLGPIGNPFSPSPGRNKPLLIGGGVGMPPMVFLADSLRKDPQKQPFVILGSEVPFPFQSIPSQIIIPGLADGVIASMPLLDDWGIGCRLASLQGFPGVFQGYVTELAEQWISSLNMQALSEVEIFACGPHPMLEAVAQLAANHNIPCQVSLEEFMACGVGGCAGCVVEVQTPQGPAMKRVCVDGPVFDAQTVFA
ncbi:MAG: dihydroorotate dehydrogenase electron transfer subunit [Candidatus Thiodiazotropha sp. (ex Lucina aurantia)]|uniref:Dihydroorotate dehydrogenase B, electron transfer subunit n=2 Tax=Candidatus Thiodiazotropha TaxID=1913444 RepID=A0A7Z0VN77_9GAMM|nr:dihydroorotate dehydrogenase electron transfer subunit [Candidatus Thiodiazotropha endolucinida]MBT3010733.1 dihydroorotate dehydrogenase electron transfer subunit [Candidatus Thiodiazotropha sp. (ex Lucina pensylvanica)]MBT3015354.1 dihydroorotate dehydrogenase electron transfer subunit [Candidatus Thiodiazotropha taylori]MBT3039030.1 dihydroorotate dehydrogenase electron transfer subunit [Candidatus Thiodiazotropha sp. (ex Codakia orbicularis)]MBV2101991.1 dihydroorotate dehydrogenase elec